MANGVRLLLRLPPCLRQQIAQEPPIANGPRILIKQHRVALRTFASKSKPSSRNRSLPAKAPPKASAPTRSTRSAGTTLPLPAPSASVGRAFIDTYEPSSERVLLYASPKHGTFYAASYLIGGFLLLGGYSYAEMFLKDRPGQQTPWLLKGVGAFSTICVVAFGTTLVLAPKNMIKSISIVSSKAADKAATQGSRILRLEIKRALPFLKPDVLETSPKRVFLDRDVPLAALDLNFLNIPIGEAQTFTERYFSPVQAKSSGFGDALASFNKSLLATWPAVKRETRRMLLRDQMAYVQVEGNGTFKLDLQQCHMLDMGRPLHRVITADASAKPSIVRWFSRLFSDSSGKRPR